jgi:hypothetical protein
MLSTRRQSDDVRLDSATFSQVFGDIAASRFPTGGIPWRFEGFAGAKRGGAVAIEAPVTRRAVHAHDRRPVGRAQREIGPDEHRGSFLGSTTACSPHLRTLPEHAERAVEPHTLEFTEPCGQIGARASAARDNG